MKVLQNIDFREIISDPARAVRVTIMWQLFGVMYAEQISSATPDARVFAAKLAEFMELFCSGPRPAQPVPVPVPVPDPDPDPDPSCFSSVAWQGRSSVQWQNSRVRTRRSLMICTRL